MDRRNFLLSSAASVLLASCQSLIPSRGYSSRKGHLWVGIPGTTDRSILRKLDLDTYGFQDFEVPLSLPHSLFFNRSNPSEAYIFEMLGSAAKLDLQTGKCVLIDHRRGNGNLFVGHAIDAGDDIGLLCLEYRKDFSIEVGLRDKENLSLKRTLSGFDVGHHVVRLPDTTVAVSSGRNYHKKKNFITFYDFKSNSVIRQIECPHRFSHLTPVSSSEVLGVSLETYFDEAAMRSIDTSASAVENLQKLLVAEKFQGPSPVYYASTNGDLRVLWDETQKSDFGWGFGVERIPSKDGLFVTGHYQSGTVIVWKNFAIVKTLRVPGPLGIVSTKDGEQFIVLSEGKIHVFSTETFLQVKEIGYQKGVSFIYRYG